MKKFFLAAAGIGALCTGVPASAQVSDILRQGIESILGGNRASDIEPRLIDLNTRIQTSYQRGEISQSQAAGLQSELRGIANQEQAYRSGGISRSERADLEQRLRIVEGRIQQASYDGNRDGRDWNDDRDQRDWRDRDGRYDRNERDYRDDRWSGDDRRYGRDGCPPGLERKNNGCLPPGQAMQQGDRYANQYARVPARYGERYRDTNRFLYRYDAGRIYQVDRRTNRIVNVTVVRR